MIINFSIISILKDIKKEILITTIFVFLITILSAVFFIKDSIYYQIKLQLDNQNDITIQNIKGGLRNNISIDYIDEISQIAGITKVYDRIYGQYHFELANRYFTIMGIDIFDEKASTNISNIVDKIDINKLIEDDWMIVSNTIKNTFDKYYYKDFFNFLTVDNQIQLKIKAVFKSEISFETDNLILVSKDNSKLILGINDDECTDIVIKVSNPLEIPIITTKIRQLYPEVKVITKEKIQSIYKNLFDYKGGFFLSLFIVSLVTFILILFLKGSSFNNSDKKKIAILRAVGWSINDIIKYKIYQAIIISIFAFIIAVNLAYIYVYIFDAPILKNIFFGDNNFATTFNLIPNINFFTIIVLFFITIPLYVLSTIIPAWKISIKDINNSIK
jgi:ABC-type lipoprotein release transport system permease subunit